MNLHQMDLAALRIRNFVLKIKLKYVKKCKRII
jgi:hypothetical protein